MPDRKRARNKNRSPVKLTIQIVTALFILDRMHRLAKKFGKLTNRILCEKSHD